MLGLLSDKAIGDRSLFLITAVRLKVEQNQLVAGVA
jgi:hypothetical protein